MVRRPFEISLHRLRPRLILCLPEGRKWVHRALDLLKHRFLDVSKSHFKPSMKQKISLQEQATPLNFAFSNPPKSHFTLSRRKRMNSQVH
jgi:hypothetical protein